VDGTTILKKKKIIVTAGNHRTKKRHVASKNEKEKNNNNDYYENKGKNHCRGMLGEGCIPLKKGGVMGEVAEGGHALSPIH